MFFDLWMCAFVVLGLVFPYQAKRLAWGMSPKWPILCQVERKILISHIINGYFSYEPGLASSPRYFPAKRTFGMSDMVFVMARMPYL